MLNLYLVRKIFNFEKFRQYITGKKNGNRLNIYLLSCADCHLLYSYTYCIWLSEHKNIEY